jgi:type IV pilus assembly protein PilB
MRKSLKVSADAVFYKGVGCEYCHHTGYQGRRAVYELLVNSPLIRRAIVPHANSDELEQLAIEDGMVPLTDQALKLAQAQITSLEEVYRVRLN